MMTIIFVMCEFFWEISFSFLPKYYTYLKKLITYAIHKIQKEVETFFLKLLAMYCKNQHCNAEKTILKNVNSIDYHKKCKIISTL